MEAISVEDSGAGISFNVYCYNVQPGIVINYETGESSAEDGSAAYGSDEAKKEETYIANKNTKKFHYPGCDSVNQMKEKNKKYMNCTRKEVIEQGYEPCGRCGS